MFLSLITSLSGSAKLLILVAYVIIWCASLCKCFNEIKITISSPHGHMVLGMLELTSFQWIAGGCEWRERSSDIQIPEG